MANLETYDWWFTGNSLVIQSRITGLGWKLDDAYEWIKTAHPANPEYELVQEAIADRVERLYTNDDQLAKPSSMFNVAPYEANVNHNVNHNGDYSEQITHCGKISNK